MKLPAEAGGALKRVVPLFVIVGGAVVGAGVGAKPCGGDQEGTVMGAQGGAILAVALSRGFTISVGIRDQRRSFCLALAGLEPVTTADGAQTAPLTIEAHAETPTTVDFESRQVQARTANNVRLALIDDRRTLSRTENSP